jgi:hypothetical protein
MNQLSASLVRTGLLGLAALLAAIFPTPRLAGAACNFTDAPAALTGVVNTYYPGTLAPAAGANAVTVDTAAIRGSGTLIAAGDLLLVIQIQGADFDTDNNNGYGDNVNGDPASGYLSNANFIAGRYEYVVAAAAVGASPGVACPAAPGKLCIIGTGAGDGLLYSYSTTASNTDQNRYQVIRVPQYRNATLAAGLTAAAWDGRTGGVLAVDFSGTATLGGTVSVDGLGFRGGGGRALNGLAGNNGNLDNDYRSLSTLLFGGSKGEGICATPQYVYNGTAALVNSGAEGLTNGSHLRGAPGNAGGGGNDDNPAANDQNGGGGGGGNGGAGGLGGNTWSGNQAYGGFGGVALPAAAGQVFLGGGGGGGARNNSAGVQSSGGIGGGLVMLRAYAFAGAGTISANGSIGPAPDNDGAGGGGAGGTILVATASGTLAGLTARANGAAGADAWIASAPGGFPGNRHGPGGGGGGGAILLSGVPAASSVAGGTAGRTTTAQDTYGATAGGAGVVQTAILFDGVPGIQTCLAVTRATIGGLRVNPGSVEFATEQQRRTVGFNVFATADPFGAAGRRRLNGRFMPAPVPDSIRPILYRLETGPILEPYILIEEIEAGGRRRELGPFAAGDTALREAFEDIEARLRRDEAPAGGDVHPAVPPAGPALAARAARARTVANHPPTANPSSSRGVKIEVAGAGRVQVPVGELSAAGLPLAGTAPWNLRLTNLGKTVPFTVAESDDGTPAAILFEAEELSTDYTGRNVYLLTTPRALKPQMAVPLSRSGFARTPGATRVEPNQLYAPFVAFEADPWVWDILVTGMGSVAEYFDLPGAAADTDAMVPVRIGFAGGSKHAHRITAALNGYPLGSADFDGLEMAWVSGEVPGAALRPAGNELTLSYDADLASEEDVGLAFLDLVEVGLPPARGDAAFELLPYDPRLPSFSGKNYLIVTHALFRDQAERLALLKAGEGLSPVVVDVERAYDRYATGVFEAQAVRRLIKGFAAGKPAAAVLLLGGDTFDPRGFSDAPGLTHDSFVPSLFAWDGEFGRVPSENLYADTGRDGRPEVAIGRLPVKTPEQADTMVEKIAIQYTLLGETASQLVIADNRSPGDIDFRVQAERTATLLGGAQLIAVADGAGAARSALLERLACGGGGAAAMHYFGHGGWGRWADEGVLRHQDAAGFTNSGCGSVLFAWTCNVQWYLNDEYPAVNEALMLVPRGGAVASFGPAGITDPALQSLFFPIVYRNLSPGRTLGEALRRAKAEALRVNPILRPVVEGWNLLGDPALRLVPRVP